MKFHSISFTRLCAFVLMAGILTAVVANHSLGTVSTFAMPVSKKNILIDAGHGGWDPGKVGGSETLEKEINLAIAKKLQTYLEIGGSYAMMTRIKDEALGNKKSSDMDQRRYIANASKADMLISIHQNSYPDSSTKGAQVFYFDDSNNSKLLASCIQSSLNSFPELSTKRIITPNSNYYMLKRSSMPAVIVECGFLTNPAEKAKLRTDQYQERVAWAIYLGVVKYYQELDNQIDKAE